MLLTNDHFLIYNQNDSFALFFETEIKATIQVLRFKSPSVYKHFMVIFDFKGDNTKFI